MNLLLDTSILGRLCHPKQKQNRPVAKWLADLLVSDDEGLRIFVPEIADYELRRKLLHLLQKKQSNEQSINRLNSLNEQLEYLPISTQIMRRAAEMWALARSHGVPTTDESAIDGDVILAAQVESVAGIVVTENPKHLKRFVASVDLAHAQANGLDEIPFVGSVLTPHGFAFVDRDDGTQVWIREKP